MALRGWIWGVGLGMAWLGVAEGVALKGRGLGKLQGSQKKEIMVQGVPVPPGAGQ